MRRSHEITHKTDETATLSFSRWTVRLRLRLHSSSDRQCCSNKEETQARDGPVR